jgi:transcriptional regulator with XRE-family HTH domain
MHPDMSNVSRRVFELRKKLNMKQGPFGRLLGVDQSTVSKWESGRQVPEGPSLIKLAEMAMMSPRDFLGEGEIKVATTINVSVIGAVQGGHWEESTMWPESKQYQVSVSYEPEYKNATRFALEVRGPSMNQEYPDGSILDCVSIHDLPGPIKSGDHVIVQRTRADGLRESTCKEYFIEKDGSAWLWPRSKDPHHQLPISYEPDSDPQNGVESVEITALVVGSYRKRVRSPA